jgi:hypothetical protein
MSKKHIEENDIVKCTSCFGKKTTKEILNYNIDKSFDKQVFENVECYDCKGKGVITVKFDTNFGCVNTHPIKAFINDCKSGCLIDYDGYGRYGFENKRSNIFIIPSHVKNGLVLEGFTHIHWYNR